MGYALISFILNWVLYFGLFPVAFFWLRRSQRIFIKKDYSEVALKRGESPPNPKRWAPFTGISNLVGGLIAIWLIIAIPMGLYDFAKWIEIAGLTFWGKIIFDFIISRQAHPFTLGREKQEKKDPE